VAVAASFILVLGIVLPRRVPRTMGGSGVLDGIRLIASRPDLRTLLLLASIPTFFVYRYIGFLDVYTRDILKIGAEGLGLLMAVSGCGAIVGSLLVASAGKSEGTGRLLLRMTVLYGLPVVGVALSCTLWFTLPLHFIAGMLGAAFMSGNNALVQHRVTEDVRGRVTGANMLTWGLMPPGSLPIGMLADLIGTPAAVAGGAIISSVLASVLGLTSSEARGI
jgi:MFS transporter, DHA1 family, staphyloferrin A biosynthesis exporter